MSQKRKRVHGMSKAIPVKVSVGLDWKEWPGLTNYLQYCAVLLPWASHTGLVLKNWPTWILLLEKLSQRVLAASVQVLHAPVLSWTQEAHNRHGTNWWLVVEQMVPTASSCGLWWANAVTSSWFNSRLEVWIWTDILFEIQLFTAKKSRVYLRPNRIYEYVMIGWLVSEMRCNSFSLLSLHQCSCLKNVLTLEHRVIDGDKFAQHPDREFVPFTVCKLVRWSFLISCPGLLRSWTTETPITKSESCCVSKHFFRLSWTFILQLHQDKRAIQCQLTDLQCRVCSYMCYFSLSFLLSLSWNTRSTACIQRTWACAEDWVWTDTHLLLWACIRSALRVLDDFTINHLSPSSEIFFFEMSQFPSDSVHWWFSWRAQPIQLLEQNLTNCRTWWHSGKDVLPYYSGPLQQRHNLFSKSRWSFHGSGLRRSWHFSLGWRWHRGTHLQMACAKSLPASRKDVMRKTMKKKKFTKREKAKNWKRNSQPWPTKLSELWVVDVHGQVWHHGQTSTIPLAHIFRQRSVPNQSRK